MAKQVQRFCFYTIAISTLLICAIGVSLAEALQDSSVKSTYDGIDFDTDRPGQLRRKKTFKYTDMWLTGLPVMSEDHSPNSDGWSNSVAICAIMRDENVTDVIEWLSYYKWLGVDHIFLTDNGSSDRDITLPQIRSTFDASFLTLREELYPRAQLKAYAWCAEEQRENYNWIAYFDLDEFLVLRGDEAAKPDLKGFLNDYKHENALSINWVVVGPSGREKRPDSGGVLGFYDQCVPTPDRHIKTIVNTWFLEGVGLHPHNFHYRNGEGSVNENHVKLPEMWAPLPVSIQKNQWTLDQCKEAANSDSPQLKDHCILMPSPLMFDGTIDRVVLFHFSTKSVEDFELKVARGSGMSGKSKGDDYFNNIVMNQAHAPICNEPKALYQECCAPGVAQKDGHVSVSDVSETLEADTSLGDGAGTGHPGIIMVKTRYLCKGVKRSSGPFAGLDDPNMVRPSTAMWFMFFVTGSLLGMMTIVQKSHWLRKQLPRRTSDYDHAQDLRKRTVIIDV